MDQVTEELAEKVAAEAPNQMVAEQVADKVSDQTTYKTTPKILPTSPRKQFVLLPKSHRRPRYIPAVIKHQVTARDRGCCTYEDPVTKKRCSSRFGLEFDHVKPHAAGGANTAENLRLRCRTHNKLHARKELAVGNVGGNES